MERVQSLPGSLPLAGVRRLDAPAIATWAYGAAVVAYLLLQNGGYDPIVRDEVGIATWIIAIGGIAVGAFPLPTSTRFGTALLAAFAAYVVWTALSMDWTISRDQTADELARVCTYGGILVLGLCAVGDGRRARHLLGGVTAAIGVVAVLAVLSRLQPDWFPENLSGLYLPDIEIERRLAYPLGYSSAVGVMAAVAVALLAGATAWSRTIPAQVLAAAALPIAGFALVLSSSGTGTGATIAAIVALVVLSPDRIPKILTLLTASAGSLLLFEGITDRPALDRGLPTPAAIDQGGELLLIAVVVAVGVGLVQLAISLAVTHGTRPRWLLISRRNALIATLASIAVLIPALLAAGLAGELSDGWDRFKSRGASADQADRGAVLTDASSSGRYQFWMSAQEANDESPLKGTGPGTFEFHWAQDPDNFGYVRNSHSLYFDNLAELGWVGLILIVLVAGGALAIGVWRAFTAPPAARARIAAAAAGIAAFAVGAGLDWIWEIPALPAIFLLLAVVVSTDTEVESVDKILVRRTRRRRRASEPSAVRRVAPRVAFVAAGLAALFAIWGPLSANGDLRESHVAVAEGRLPAALASAEAAAEAQPDNAAPLIQQAVVLELAGDYEKATAAARAAVDAEPANWRNWVTLARIEARGGDAVAAVRAYRKSEELNP